MKNKISASLMCADPFNVYTLEDLQKKGISPLAYRFFTYRYYGREIRTKLRYW